MPMIAIAARHQTDATAASALLINSRCRYKEMAMKLSSLTKIFLLASILFGPATLSSAFAGAGPLAHRSGYSYVSPEMMHAINVIVAEKMKMRHHTR